MRHRFMIALLGLFLAGTAGAATLYVGPSETYPTIQAAIAAASDHDTIIVADGIYDGNIIIDKDIILLSANGRGFTTIIGNQTGGELGAIQIAPGSDGVQIGATNQGFKIIGIDGPPAIEKAAIYLQQNHTNMIIRGNEIVAQGDACLSTEYNMVVTYVTIDDNIFSGQAFIGPNPAGEGSGEQFTLPNVPRQLVVMGGGAGGTNTQYITFTNNEITGTAGGWNTAGAQQGNNLVTIDADNSTITGNTFQGTTTRYATSLRCRRPGMTINGNSFISTGLTSTCGQVFLQNTALDAAFIAANTFDKGVYVAAAGGTVALSVQAAVALVPINTTINVLPGTYIEQIHVTTSGTQLLGAGVDLTIIKSPATLTYSFSTGVNNFPIVFVDGATGVNISHLTVDGDHKGNANYRFQGIGFWNSGGSVQHAKVLNIMDNPFSGAQHGVGIYAYNNTGGPYTVALEDVLVDDFQKTALALLGAGLTIDLDEVTTVGAGPTGVTAQNGIQVGFGAAGTVDDCVISGIAYTGADWTATGFLGYQAGTMAANGVDIDGCQTSVYWQDSSGSFDDLTIINPLGDAFYAYSTGAKANDSAPRPLAQPLLEDMGGGGKSAVTVSVTNSVVTGAGVADSWGIAAWGYGPVTFNVTGCTITNWDLGVVAYDAGGASINMTADQNVLSPNGSYGLYSNAVETADASCNWWGDITGPFAPPLNSGTGEAIFGPSLNCVGESRHSESAMLASLPFC